VGHAHAESVILYNEDVDAPETSLRLLPWNMLPPARGHGTRWTAETGRARACRRVDLRTEVLAEGLSKTNEFVSTRLETAQMVQTIFFRTPEEVVVLGEEM